MKGAKIQKALSSLQKKLLATEDIEAFGCLLKEAGTHKKCKVLRDIFLLVHSKFLNRLS